MIMRSLPSFIISAIILGVISFILGNFIIPKSNIERINFENKYLEGRLKYRDKNIHIQIEPGQYIYMKNFNKHKHIGYRFTVENFKNGELISKLKANYVQYDTITNKWNINKYEIREFKKTGDIITTGKNIDTTLNLKPSDFFIQRNNLVETMNLFELNHYIKQEELKGNEQIVYHKIEKHKRIAFPFSAIILTLIAVALSSRKIRGGVGIHLGIGMLIAFTYILFMQVSTTFATNSNLSASLAVWIPNLTYILLATILVYKAPK